MSRRTLTGVLAALLLLALALAAPAGAAGLTVRATRDLVTWEGAGEGCVYWIDPGGFRTRLGCSYTPSWAPPPGILFPGDLVEVRRPRAGQHTLTGRAVVEE